MKKKIEETKTKHYIVRYVTEYPEPHIGGYAIIRRKDNKILRIYDTFQQACKAAEQLEKWYRKYGKA